MIILKKDPPAPPPPRPPWVVTRRPRLGFVYTGTDGSTWDLYNGPVRLARGVAGLGLPVPEHARRDSVAADGVLWERVRHLPREVQLPLAFASRDWRTMSDTIRSLSHAFDPELRGSLEVVRPDNERRRISLRYEGGWEGVYDVDPLWIGQEIFTVSLVAEDPWPTADPIGYQLVFEQSQTFFGAGAPPFLLGNSNSIERGIVENPGDLPAWPVYRANGPFTSFTLGVGPSLVSMNISKPEGGWVLIDMTPGSGRITDETGQNKIGNVTDVRFAPIPPGPEVHVELDVQGAVAGTSVDLNFTPRYRRLV